MLGLNVPMISTWIQAIERNSPVFAKTLENWFFPRDAIGHSAYGDAETWRGDGDDDGKLNDDSNPRAW